MIDASKMIYGVTDGVARPNPGTAGWGVIIRQNKAFTMIWKHFQKATNNTMELRAVTEALASSRPGWLYASHQIRSVFVEVSRN
jgi:ribonuclease HI